MKLSLICFTGAGTALCARLVRELSFRGHQCRGFALEKFLNPLHEANGLEPLKTTLSEWTKAQFETRDGIIFIGAAGIAVRAVAPWVKDKRTDPAVVVMDDAGRFSISLLSGHFGGANELAGETAGITGGTAVITTATDIHGRFAVDEFAKAQGLWLSDRKAAKAVSADVLAGEPVGFFCDFPAEGAVPEGFTQRESCKRNVWITVKRHPEEGDLLPLFLPEDGEILRLVPRNVILGIGCRRGTEKKAVEDAVEAALARWNIERMSVAAAASIDLKKDEEGLTAFTEEWGLDFKTYPASRLMEAAGKFTASSFVQEVTGADNVCERAAVCLAMELGGGRLIRGKQAEGGVTVAAAVRDWKVKL